MLDFYLTGGKIEALKMLDLETKSTHFGASIIPGSRQ